MRTIGKNKELYEGVLFNTNSYGLVEVLEYKGNTKVRVKFINTGYETEVALVNLKAGKIKDKSLPTVYGVGRVWDVDVKNNVKATKQYLIWCNMLKRCYCGNSKLNYQSYAGCTVSEYFQSFDNFASWCEGQVGYETEGFQLDKDILSKNCKQYSPQTCCFVPRDINMHFSKHDRKMRKLPLGVKYHKHNSKYSASLSVDGVLSFIGYYSDKMDAFLAYKQAKEQRAKNLAEKWKDQIDPRVYEALMNYQVEITD